MKKKIAWGIMLITVLTIFVGCQNSHTQSSPKDAYNKEIEEDGKSTLFSESAYREKICDDRTNLEKYHTQYQDDIEHVQKNTYQKLKFDQCVFADLPDSNSVCVMDVEDKDISVDESISIIKKWLADIGKENIDFDKQLRDASGQLERDDSQEYPFDYPSVMEHKDELTSGRGFFINTNSCYIQMGTYGIYSMSDGTITEFLGEDGFAAFDALGGNEEEIVAEGTLDELESQSYELLSGKVSISEAAEMTKKYFEAGTPFSPSTGIGIDIPYVSVFSLGNKYGYAFWLRRTYQNIPFAYTFGGSRREVGEEAVFEDSKTAYVVNGQTVSAYTGHNEAQPLHVLLEERDILSLKDAMELLDSKLAKELQIQVGNVGIAYCDVSLDDGQGSDIIFPCWALDGMNQNSDRRIRIYMDVLTGDLYMYTYPQQAETED